MYNFDRLLQFRLIVMRKEAPMSCTCYYIRLAKDQPPDDPDEDKGGGDGE